MSARTRLALGALLAAALAAASGCGRPEPLALRVGAASPAAFAAWRQQVREQAGPRLMSDIDDAVAEIGLRLAEASQPGAADTQDAVLRAIDGHSIRQVLALGLGWKLERLESERATLQRSLGGWPNRGPLAGERGSGASLSDLHARQLARLKAIDEEIAAARARLQAVREREGGPGNPWDPSQGPTPMPPLPPVIRVPGR